MIGFKVILNLIVEVLDKSVAIIAWSELDGFWCLYLDIDKALTVKEFENLSQSWYCDKLF